MARLVLRGLVLAALAFLVGVIGMVAGLLLGENTATVIIRAALVGLFLVGAGRFLALRADDDPPQAPRAEAMVLGAGLLGYLLDPWTWGGRTLIGQAFLDAGPLTMIIDLVGWMLLVWLGGRWGTASAANTRVNARSPYP